MTIGIDGRKRCYWQTSIINIRADFALDDVPTFFHERDESQNLFPLSVLTAESERLKIQTFLVQYLRALAFLRQISNLSADYFSLD